MQYELHKSLYLPLILRYTRIPDRRRNARTTAIITNGMGAGALASACAASPDKLPVGDFICMSVAVSEFKQMYNEFVWVYMYISSFF